MSVKAVLLVFIFLLLLSPLAVMASSSNGTIDAAHEYAWGDQLGWVNFGTSGGNVHVTDTGLTGYAWSANYGWINLAPSKSGVKNDGNGNLSGYAWAENLGYINFADVVITNSGKFTGSAIGASSTITFDCAECDVVTDWTPASVRNAGGGGGGGGGGSVGVAGGGSGGAETSGTVTTFPNLPTANYCGVQAAVGDFNCDGRINVIDLSILLYYYGQSGTPAARYDLGHDGSVDFPDISILMYHWTG